MNDNTILIKNALIKLIKLTNPYILIKITYMNRLDKILILFPLFFKGLSICIALLIMISSMFLCVSGLLILDYQNNSYKVANEHILTCFFR